MTDAEAHTVIQKIAEVATGVGWQAGVPGADIAGMIVSHLAIHPEHVARFLAEGSELFVDGTIRPEAGSLSYQAMNGQILTPSTLRQMKGVEQ